MGYRLGVDLGTTFTAAAVDDGSGPTMLGLGNRALTVPSAVFLAEDGSFLFGEAADRRAATEPSRVAVGFKRRIGDTVPILLAGQPFSPQALSARLLAWVVSVATERQGGPPELVVVTHPANWGGYKRELLHQLVTLADLPDALTCTEPEAAALQYASRGRLETGDKVVVYDLGGGTFDVCVLEKLDGGFTILGSPDGVEHLGGVDFDEAVFHHVLGMLDDRIADLDPDDPLVTESLARLRRECVEAKEALSTDVETTIAVSLPGVTTSLRITRSELESLITSPLRDTLDATQRALRSADVAPADLSAVVLVGGSSRIPLVSHLLQAELGVQTAMDTHPKHDIALGAVRLGPPASGESAPPPAPAVVQWPTRGTGPSRAEQPTVPVPPPAAPAPEETPTATTDAPAASDEKTPRGAPIWQPPSAGVGAAGAGAAGPPAAEATGLGRSRRPVLIAIGVLVGLGAISATGFALTRGGSEPTSGEAASPSSSNNDVSSGSSGAPQSSSPTGEPETAQPPVLARDVVLVSLQPEGSTDLALVRVSTASDSFGLNRGPLVDVPGSQTLPSQSRDGRFVTYRQGQAGGGVAYNGPWTMKVVADDGQPRDFFAVPLDRKVCESRVGWHPDGEQVLLNCFDDEDEDGVRDKVDGRAQPQVYLAPVDENGQVDGTDLTFQFTNTTPTDTSPGGAPDSWVFNPSFLPGGEIAVSYEHSDLAGVYVFADGAVRRLTAGTDGDPVASPTENLVAFSRDGDLFVASTDGTPPCPAPGQPLIDAVTGTALCNLTTDSTSPEQRVTDPTWSWDGATIAFEVEAPTPDAGPAPSTLELIDLASGDRRPLITPAIVMGASGWGPR